MEAPTEEQYQKVSFMAFGDKSTVARHPLISIDLTNLGHLDSRFENVLAPAIREEAVGLTAQFTDNAETYANAYASTPYFTWLIKRAVALADLSQAPRDILDIGAGAGDNSTFPAAEMWPEASIIATDLSAQLLAILNREAKKREVSSRLTIVCVDAMNDIFEEQSFDLVMGSAILHHLIEPLDALKAAHRVLRPGGIAIFFEPFELGYSLVANVFDRISSESTLRNEPLSPEIISFMKNFVQDIKRRLGTDKSAPLYREIDDKWLFTKPYFTEAAAKIGFSDCLIECIQEPKLQLSRYIKTFLRIGAKTTVDTLPAWAQHLCEAADEMFVESTREIITEAIVVMKK